MKRFGLIVVLLVIGVGLLMPVAALTPTASASEAFVLLQDLALWKEERGTLKWQENLTIGDKLSLLGATAKFKVEGAEREYLKVKTSTAKEGWVRSNLIAANTSLAIIKVDAALVYAEPRDVKITADSIPLLGLVAVHKDGMAGSFIKITCYDSKKDAIRSQVYINRDDITSDEVDINAAILYRVAMAQKQADLKKNLLTVAVNKYGRSIFTDKIRATLNPSGATATVPAAAPSTSPRVKDTAIAMGSFVVNDTKVNVRSQPDELNGAVIGVLNKPDTVQVTEVTTESYTIAGMKAPWYHIEEPDGWVFGAFLSPAP